MALVGFVSSDLVVFSRAVDAKGYPVVHNLSGTQVVAGV
jgi:hypothetical protein